MRGHLLLVIASCAACQPTTDKPPPIKDTDASTWSPRGGGTTCGFNEQAIALPAAPGTSGTPFASLGGVTACATSSSQLDYGLADVDGDGLADLVVTRACDDASVGTSMWLVYPNTGTSFGAAVQYALPALPTTPNCVTIALADADGDSKLDFIVTSSCVDATVGTTQWLVYRNTGGGFSTAAQSFALPAGAALHAFPSLEVDTPTCNAGKPAFAFYDVTGDFVPDSVVTTACDDVSVGATHWRVYPGTGTGVGAPIAFTLPGGAVFARPLGGDIACSNTGFSSPRYAVIDFDGDRKLDLVVTKSCTDANAGATNWSVYANTGAAFAVPPTYVPLPSAPGQPAGAFDAIVGSTSCGAGSSTASLTHSLVDVDGDLKPDMVVTEACNDTQTGVVYWLVFPNTGATFDAPAAYGIPALLGATSSHPIGLSGALSCSAPATPAYESAHVLGLELDVVETQACSDATLGVSRWLAMRAHCGN